MKNDFFIKASPQKIFKKFTRENTSWENRRSRIVLLLFFVATVALVGIAVLYRELPNFFKKLNEPAAVVSQRFAPISPTATPTPMFIKEKQAVEELLKPLRGKYGVVFLDLASGSGFSINGAEQFTAASLIKMPVLITLYKEAEKGLFNLDQIYKLKAVDKRGGAGALQYREEGYAISFRKMAELMGKQSDNTAFNVVSKTLGTEKIQEVIDNLGMKNTSFEENLTSPEDITLLFEKLYKNEAVSEKNKEEILAFITDTIWEDRIPAGLPKEIKSAHKIGSEIGVVSDAGIVFAEKPFILTILSEGVNEIEAKEALPEITKKIYEQMED